MGEKIASMPCRKCLISLDEARQTIERLDPLNSESVAIASGVGRITARDAVAVSACPSSDSSLKDGFAVVSSDIAGATKEQAVRLTIDGTVTAGEGNCELVVRPGRTVRIMTGAVLPPGADAVLSSEFARVEGKHVYVFRDAHAGRNVLQKGRDVEKGRVVIAPSTRLRATHIGLLAAAGVDRVVVFRKPAIVIVATGSELVIPGQPIGPGKVAASNAVTLQATLKDHGLDADTVIIHDDLDNLKDQMAPLLDQYDVMLTCGGVLDGDKDLTMQSMDLLQVESIFRRVRVGPGKGICCGRRKNTLIFNLPGGPPSNHIAFLLLAFPAIRRLCGHTRQFERFYSARLTRPLNGQFGWTEIIYATLNRVGSGLQVTPLETTSRLQAMAQADCLIELPENQDHGVDGESVRIWKIK